LSFRLYGIRIQENLQKLELFAQTQSEYLAFRFEFVLPMSTDFDLEFKEVEKRRFKNLELNFLVLK
tara:strand:- start:10304 stop:10501 length:198 start_codon:yes stop_codon:yes gene_type:complete